MQTGCKQVAKGLQVCWCEISTNPKHVLRHSTEARPKGPDPLELPAHCVAHLLQSCLMTKKTYKITKNSLYVVTNRVAKGLQTGCKQVANGLQTGCNQKEKQNKLRHVLSCSMKVLPEPLQRQGQHGPRRTAAPMGIRKGRGQSRRNTHRLEVQIPGEPPLKACLLWCWLWLAMSARRRTGVPGVWAG